MYLMRILIGQPWLSNLLGITLMLLLCIFIGPAIVTAKDAGDAVTLLQSLAGSTFDSSQLVFTACMGYQPVNEMRLQELRNKHRPSVIAAMEERSRGLRVWKDSKSLATKLYSFKRNENVGETNSNGDMQFTGSDLTTCDGEFGALEVDTEVDSLPDLQEQVFLQLLPDTLCVHFFPWFSAT